MNGTEGPLTVLSAFKRTADSGAAECPLDLRDATVGRYSPCEVSSGDRNIGRFSGYGTTSDWGPNPVPVDGTWVYYASRFPGDDTFALYSMVEGAGSWTAGATGTGGGGFADVSIVNLFLGRLSDGALTYTGECAMLKSWNLDIAVADLLTNAEHQWLDPQENLAQNTAAFGFEDNGGVASAVDRSGTGNLTLTSSPAYSSDLPSDILGDSPGGASKTATIRRRRDFMSFATLAAPAVEVFGRIFARSASGLMLPQGA